jgi:uncharacterized protein (UPF0216 family)
MNRHVPTRRVSLGELRRQEEAGYQAKDGRRYHISKEEIELVASLLEPWDQERIKLPIIIMTDASEGGMWKVMGKLEVRVVSQLVGRSPEFEDRMRLFHPHVVELRRRLPTATTTVFSP